MSAEPSREDLRIRANAYLDSYNIAIAKASLFSRQLRRIIQENTARIAANESEREALIDVNSFLEGAINGRNQSALTILGSYLLTLQAFRNAGGVAKDYERIPAASSARPVESRFSPTKAERTPIGTKKST